MGAGDPGAFHSIRAAAVAFLLGSLLLGGCIFSRSPTRSPGAVVGEPHPDPGGVLEVPREGSLSVPLTRATSRWEIPLSPLWHGDRILVRGPARKGWRLLDVDPQGGVALLAVPREGTYLLCASPGSAPPVAPRGTLRLVVDRSPPAMELVLKRLSPRQGGEEPGLMLRWRVEDRLPLAEGVEIAYRSPGDDGWRVLSLRHDARGVVSWPIFPQPLRGHRLRLRARDLAGNRGLLEGSLAAGLAGTLRNGPGELLWGTKEQREEEVSPVVTAAAPKPTAEEERQWVDPFEELRRQGPILPGEGRLPIPSGIDEVALLLPSGREVPLERLGDGGAILPRWTGGPFQIELRGQGRRLRSPTFALDSTPPRVRLIECTPRSTGVTLRWSAADQEDRGEPQVSLHLRSGEGWEERPLPAGGTASISLPEGSCSLYLSARDRCGNRSGAPLPGEILTIDVGASGPRPLNFSGETFRGGDAHYIFIDPGPAAGGASAIEVRAVSLSGGAPLEIATIPWGQKIILWELPFRSGRYRLELSWREAGGGRRSARSPEAFTIDADPPRLQWDRVPRAVGTEALLSLVSVGGDRHEIEDVRLLRRRREQDPWEELPGEPSIRLPGEGRVEALIATASWEEGEWRIGFTASDSLGNRTSPPLSTPPLRVDHTPVKLPPFSIPGVLVEGLAGIEPPLLAEVPARAELQWLRVGEEPWPVELRWTSRGEGFGAPPVALPPGRGRLLLTVVDEAGNHSWREEEGVEVLPALARPLELFPRPPLPAGSRLLVQIHLREPHPEADGSLLLQLIDAGVADPSEGARRTRASLPISRSSQKIVLELPDEPGLYLAGIAAAGSDRLLEGAREILIKKLAGGPVTRPADSPAGLVQAFRELEANHRRAAESPLARERLGPERARLEAALERAILLHPADSALRRAAARVRLLADPPDREGAVRILEEGLAREHGDDALAQLLNDLAAIELERGQAGRAKELLQRGLALSESALRRYNLGEVFASLGEPERALEEYRRAITLDRGRFAYRRAWARVSGELSPSRRLEALQVVTAWVMAEEINVEEGQVLQRQIGPFREEGR